MRFLAARAGCADGIAARNQRLGISLAKLGVRASERNVSRRLAPPGIGRFLVNEAFGNAVAPFRGKMDVYHPTLYRCMPLVRARRIVVTHHDCVHERFPQLFPDVGKVLSGQEASLLHKPMRSFVCRSRAVRTCWSFTDRCRQDPRNLSRHHARFRAMRSRPRNYAWQQRRAYLLYVGSRAAYKNFDGLLKAFHESRLQDSLDLLVLGGGPLTTAETALIAKLGLSELRHRACRIVSDESSRRHMPERSCLCTHLSVKGSDFLPWRPWLPVVRCWQAILRPSRKFAWMRRSTSIL